MMTFGAPGYLATAAIAATLVAALHWLSWRRPAPSPLPTARFVPESASRAVARDLRLTDPALLATRVAALLLAGLALAQPRWESTRQGPASVLLADRSRAVASVGAVRDSIRAHSRSDGRVSVIWFDSAIAPAVSGTSDTTVHPGRVETRASVSAALLAAVREARRLRLRYEPVTITVISPLSREEVDAATAPIRQTWNGRLELVRVAARAPQTAVGSPTRLLPPAGEPIGAATRLAAARAGAATMLRVVSSATADDSAWARAGGTLVVWDASIAAPGDSGPSGRAIAPAALLSADAAAVAPLGTTSALLRGWPILRWGDGSPAATQQSLGSGCLRTVGFSLPDRGDIALRPAVIDLVRTLVAPCETIDWRPLPDRDALLLLRREAPSTAEAGPVARALAPGPPTTGSMWTQWLLGIVAGLVLFEWWLRRVPAGSRPNDHDAVADVQVREDAA